MGGQKEKASRPRKDKQTSSFVCDFELKMTPHERRAIRSRFEAARQLYNAVLGDLLRRLSAMRSDPGWKLACELPKGAKRIEAFKALRGQYGLSEYAAHAHKSLSGESWLRAHLDVNTAQKVATRAFLAVEQYMYAKRGRPRFRAWHDPLASVEGKGAAGIRYDAGNRSILWNSKATKHSSGEQLSLPLIVGERDECQQHALRHKVKFVRILRKEARGKEKFYAQLVLEGAPLVKEKHKRATKGDVSLDMGPSAVAVVCAGHAELFDLAAGTPKKEAARRRYQRKADRQRRANNPKNFDEKGRIKPGKKEWHDSKAQKRIRGQLKEMERSLASSRRNNHRYDANRILGYGSRVLAEKISYKSWQRSHYGKSLRFRAPGLFIEILRRKASQFVDIPTRTTYLSQRCLCGKRCKKELSERKHTCACRYIDEGHYVQRDEMSAFLALFVQDDKLNERAARAAWKKWGANCLLRPLSSERSAFSAATGAGSRQSCLAENGRESSGEAQRRSTRNTAVCGESEAGRSKVMAEESGKGQNPLALVMGNS